MQRKEKLKGEDGHLLACPSLKELTEYILRAPAGEFRESSVSYLIKPQRSEKGQ
jgi:hypothetical protein